MVASAEGRPRLGDRGEQWVAVQVVLLGLALVCGLRGRRWPRRARPGLRAAAAGAALAGGALFAAGGAGLGRQLTPFPRPVEGGSLRQDGAYGLVRHPIYGGVLLLMMAWSFVTSPAALLPAGLAAPFLAAKSRREEAWLEEKHPDYAAYRESVPRRFIPFAW